MAVNYENLAAVALRLIAENGRLVTLRKLDQTPADVNKPWNGPGTAHTTVEDVSAVLIPYASDEVDGEIIKRGDNYAYVAASGITQDLTLFEELLDGTDVWHIKKGELLNPGSIAILYTLHLTR